MGKAGFVKPCIGIRHIGGDPGTAIWLAAPSATANNFRKSLVSCDLIVAAAQGPAQASRQVNLVWINHRARVGTPPEYRLVAFVPRENTCSISLKQGCWLEVAASCQQPVGLKQGFSGVGKYRVIGIQKWQADDGGNP